MHSVQGSQHHWYGHHFRTSRQLTRLVTALAGVLLMLLASPPFFAFPGVGAWLLPIGLVYLVALRFQPMLWLLVLPVFTVGLDLTTYSGRFLYNEFDWLFLLTIAASLIYGRYDLRTFRLQPGPMLVVTYMGVLLYGLQDWAVFVNPPQEAFTNPYYQPTYGYKVVKGVLWGFLLVPAWNYFCREEAKRATDWLIMGCCGAALLMGLIVLWERGTVGMILSGSDWYDTANSLLDFSRSYRVTGLFSDMHTGGEVLDGVVILLLPASLYGLFQWTTPYLRVFAASALISLAYCTLVGFTRTTYVCFALGVALYPAFLLYNLYRNGRVTGQFPVICAVSVIFVPAVVAFALMGYQINERFKTVEKDLQTRKDHWSDVIQSADDSLKRSIFGNGPGSFPTNYRYKFPNVVGAIGSFAIIPNGGGYLQLGGGRDLAIGQRVEIDSDTEYVAVLSVRSSGEGRVRVYLCERNLILVGNISPTCIAKMKRFSSENDAFIEIKIPLKAGKVGEQGALHRWPTTLYLKNPKLDSVVEISSIQLLGGDNPTLINSRFIQGMDNWFFFNDFSHLPWHIKNTWLQVWYDSGWVGLLLFLGILTLALRAMVDVANGSTVIPMKVVGVIVLCVLGIFGSPLDSSRVSWLFYFYLFSSILQLPLYSVSPKNREADIRKHMGQ